MPRLVGSRLVLALTLLFGLVLVQGTTAANLKAPKRRGVSASRSFQTDYADGRAKGKASFSAAIPAIHLDTVEGLVSVAPGAGLKFSAVFSDLGAVEWPADEFLVVYFEAPNSIKSYQNQFAWVVSKVQVDAAKREVTFFVENPKRNRDLGRVLVELSFDATSQQSSTPFRKRDLVERDVYGFGTVGGTLWSSGPSQALWQPSANVGLYCENCGIQIQFSATAYFSIDFWGGVTQLCGTVQGSVTGGVNILAKMTGSYSGSWTTNIVTIPVHDVNLYIASMKISAFLDAAAYLAATATLQARAGASRTVSFQGSMGLGCPASGPPVQTSSSVMKPQVTLSGAFQAQAHLVPGVRIDASCLGLSITGYTKVDLQAIVDGVGSTSSPVPGCTLPAPAAKVALSGQVDVLVGSSGFYTASRTISVVPKTLVAQCCGSFKGGAGTLAC